MGLDPSDSSSETNEGAKVCWTSGSVVSVVSWVECQKGNVPPENQGQRDVLNLRTGGPRPKRPSVLDYKKVKIGTNYNL